MALKTDLITLIDQAVHLDAGLVQVTGPLGQYGHGFFVEQGGNQFPFRLDEVASVDLAATPPTIHLRPHRPVVEG